MHCERPGRPDRAGPACLEEKNKKESLQNGEKKKCQQHEKTKYE